MKKNFSLRAQILSLGLGSACFFMVFYLLIHYQTVTTNVHHLSEVLHQEEADRIKAQYSLLLEHPLEETFRHVGDSSALASYLSSDKTNRFFFLPKLESELLSAQSHYQGLVHQLIVLDNQGKLITGLEGRKRLRQWDQLKWSPNHPIHQFLKELPSLRNPISSAWYEDGGTRRFFAVAPFKDPETQQQGGYLAVEANLNIFLADLLQANPQKGFQVKLADPGESTSGSPLVLKMYDQEAFLNLQLVDDFSHFRSLIQREIIKQIALAIVIFVIYYFMLNMLTQKLIEPLHKLAKATREISAGNFDAPLKWSGIRETDELIKDFQSMKGQLGRTLISKDYVDRILASLSDAVFALKPSGEIERFNPAAVEIMDCQDDLALLGQNLFNQIYPED
ncbi:MAG: HAMP domain-containing protein, partial [Bdellovibrionales bacterium]|nr:HAMP domain-containing protein [Bdellovibrionales bacterium]